MLGTLDAFEQPLDIVEVDPGAQSEPVRTDAERWPALWAVRVQPGAYRVVDNFLERASGATRSLPQLRHDIVFEGQGRSL